MDDLPLSSFKARPGPSLSLGAPPEVAPSASVAQRGVLAQATEEQPSPASDKSAMPFKLPSRRLLDVDCSSHEPLAASSSGAACAIAAPVEAFALPVRRTFLPIIGKPAQPAAATAAAAPTPGAPPAKRLKLDDPDGGQARSLVTPATRGAAARQSTGLTFGGETSVQAVVGCTPFNHALLPETASKADGKLGDSVPLGMARPVSVGGPPTAATSSSLQSGSATGSSSGYVAGGPSADERPLPAPGARPALGSLLPSPRLFSFSLSRKSEASNPESGTMTPAPLAVSTSGCLAMAKPSSVISNFQLAPNKTGSSNLRSASSSGTPRMQFSIPPHAPPSLPPLVADDEKPATPLLMKDSLAELKVPRHNADGASLLRTPVSPSVSSVGARGGGSFTLEGTHNGRTAPGGPGQSKSIELFALGSRVPKSALTTPTRGPHSAGASQRQLTDQHSLSLNLLEKGSLTSLDTRHTDELENAFLNKAQEFSKRLEEMNETLADASEKLKEQAVQLYALNNEALFLNAPALSDRIATLRAQLHDLRLDIGIAPGFCHEKEE